MEKIRIGILVNDLSIPFWLAVSIKEIQASGYAEISAVILKKRKANALKRNGYLDTLQSLPLFIANKIDRFIFKTSHDALSRVSISSVLSNFELIEVETEETKYTDTFTKESIEKVKKLNLDILFRSGFKIFKGDILTQASKLGVWSFHHGNNRYYRGKPAAFWEVYGNNPTTGFILQQLSEELDGGKIIASGEISTLNFSLYKTRQLLYWDAQGMLNLTLKKLHQKGIDLFYTELKQHQKPSIYDRELYTTPNFGQSLFYLIKMLFKWIIIKTKKYLRNKNKDWYLGWMHRKDQLSFKKIKKIIPPKNHFWADPFIVSYKGEELLFFEDFEYSKNKGIISYCKFDKQAKKFNNAQPVLETDYHLSFPFTFLRDDELYVVPETKSANSISLYQWTGEKLQFKNLLIDNVKAVDTSILYKDNKYWLFTSQQISSYGTIFHQHIYYADNLEGPYLPHAMNPINNSSKLSRAAGGILKIDNDLYRTSQDCQETYGQKIQLYRIEDLTTTNYKETWVDTIEANWEKNLEKIHTINQSDNLVVIDIYGKFKR
jgi:hypothetical protein